MKSAPLPTGQSQLKVTATLRHRHKVNDTVSVTFDPESSLEALERYTGWAARILDSHASQDRIIDITMAGVWKMRALKAERAVRDSEWRLRSDADDLGEGVHVIGLLKTGSLAIVCLQSGHWCLPSTGGRIFDLSMWRPLPAPPHDWTPLRA